MRHIKAEIIETARSKRARFREKQITLAHGAVEQQNFPNYPVVRLADCPAIEVHIKESDAPLGGGGEPGTPPVAPAVTNAIFAATGLRIRDLPISKHALKKGA